MNSKTATAEKLYKFLIKTIAGSEANIEVLITREICINDLAPKNEQELVNIHELVDTR